MNKFKSLLIILVLVSSLAAQQPQNQAPKYAPLDEKDSLVVENTLLKYNLASREVKEANTLAQSQEENARKVISEMETKYKAKFDPSTGKFILLSTPATPSKSDTKPNPPPPPPPPTQIPKK